MELTIERTELTRDCRYIQDTNGFDSFVIRETGNLDYSSAVVLLSNLAEKRDITPLEREALATAIRIIRQLMEIERT
ncbi:MAG: hypothetical protein OIN66_18135 [Candidatus Methanoperedens sp.]|nr:hypothetical protein [Candidatus Methanoperedens sp.]